MATPALTSLPGEFPWGLGGDPATAYTAEGETTRLAQYIKGKPRVEALLDALGQQAADKALALGQLDTERTLVGAFGAQLDVLGDIVGEAREGDLDDEYRPRISAKILLNNSSGTAEELYSIFELIKPATASMSIYTYEPAAFVLLLTNAVVSDTLALRFGSFLRRGRGAGIRGILQWSPALPADTFTFDGTSAQALDTGLFSGATL